MGNKRVQTTFDGLITYRTSMSKFYSLTDTNHQNMPDSIHHPCIIPREIRKPPDNVPESKRKKEREKK